LADIPYAYGVLKILIRRLGQVEFFRLRRAISSCPPEAEKFKKLSYYPPQAEFLIG
jgi:hypothetical protein